MARIALAWLAISFLAVGCVRRSDAGIQTSDHGSYPCAACLSSADGLGFDRPFTLLDEPPATDALGGSRYAAGQQWYRDNDVIRVRGQNFVKFGRLRRVDPDGMRAAGNNLQQV